MAKAGKSDYGITSDKRIFDTSVCHVKFRKPRIVLGRKLSFDHDRELGFDPNRMIDARLQGVVFRDQFAIGFRNIGVSNIEETTNDKDWPDVGPAQSPESLKVMRNRGWNRTWGGDRTFEDKWGLKKVDKREFMKTRERIQPQLSHYKYDAAPIGTSEKVFIVDEKPRSRSRSEMKPGAPEIRAEVPRTTPVIAVPSSSYEPAPAPKQETREVSPRDKKRAFAFNEYALALMEAGEYQRAMTYFNKALDLDPTEETYHINLDRCNQWLDYKRKGGRR
ncbi:MAG: tetratricopeptide repeat protein [Thermoplasmatota archaeon]